MFERARFDLLKPCLSTNVENNQFIQQLAHHNINLIEQSMKVKQFLLKILPEKQKCIPGTIQKATGLVLYCCPTEWKYYRRHVDSIKGGEATNVASHQKMTILCRSKLIQCFKCITRRNSTDSNAALSETVTPNQPIRNQRPSTRLDDFILTEEVSKLLKGEIYIVTL